MFVRISFKAISIHNGARRQYARRAESISKSRSPILSTLDPTRLKTSDHVDISSRSQSQVLIVSKDRVEAPVWFRYYKRKGVETRCPPRTTGFFYFHRPTDLPPTAAAIRFRIASVNPDHFSRGRDLLRPDGAPWEVPLPTLARSRPAVQDLLLRDGLVTHSELQHCAALFPRGRALLAQRLLHRFHQPFPVGFASAHYLQIVCGGQKYCSDVRVFHEHRKGSPAAVYPYSGIALVRFELSKLPEHRGERVAVLRVIKMIKPPELRIAGYDGYLPAPVEGELVQRPAHASRVGTQPWSRKLDSPIGKPLALLLDAEGTSPTDVLS
ncbi:hypothetical protein B0H11DRAFT_1714649 [Mycena galericulata]|nr:hypothetical protein B0H11DRAFT_1717489 [Mycena galericulata]KAJ7500490.1 hypothetical protein B0H11DRAFT_1714649 [Mycena galericulata]